VRGLGELSAESVGLLIKVGDRLAVLSLGIAKVDEETLALVSFSMENSRENCDVVGFLVAWVAADGERR